LAWSNSLGANERPLRVMDTLAPNMMPQWTTDTLGLKPDCHDVFFPTPLRNN